MADRLPPTPNGYTQMPVRVGELTIFLLNCKTCGGLVLMHRTHTDWHKKNG